jgi:hypothetical protein
MVSKLKGSRYTSGRTRDWIKVKNPQTPWAKRLEDEDWNEKRPARQARQAVAPESDTPTYGHLMKCPECGVWFDCGDIGAALAHDGPMPPPTKDKPQ